jgi:hypothetical protein
MKKVHLLTLTILCCVCTLQTIAQSAFNNCAAVFLDNTMVVDDYSPRGTCKIAKNATGELTVCTANLSPSASIPVDKIKFKIAIKDQNTGTLVMYSDARWRSKKYWPSANKATKSFSSQWMMNMHCHTMKL